MCASCDVDLRAQCISKSAGALLQCDFLFMVMMCALFAHM